MSKTNVKDELKKLDAAQLQQRIAELRKQLDEQKRAQAAGELPNRMAVRITRRAIAAALTRLNSLADDSAQAVAPSPAQEEKA